MMKTSATALYLDHNATTPLDPRVRKEINRCFLEEFGNAGSPHEFGLQSKQRVHLARDQVAKLVGARRHEVIFTSGATESNNLALLGLAEHGRRTGKRHIVSTQIEHKAILEPLAFLRTRGFEITLVPPNPHGIVQTQELLAAVRPDTLLVSVMHVNNETGAIQPIGHIAEGLLRHDHLWLHVDAAQGFGKVTSGIDHPRIDMLSVSSHKINGPAGVGALVLRKRGTEGVPIEPLMHGGGQELGLRPGTLPVALISGFGLAAELAGNECSDRREHCTMLRDWMLFKLSPLHPVYHGDMHQSVPHVLCVSFPGWDADALIEELTGIAAISTGSACTSICATASHVLSAMKVPQPSLDEAVRISWSHLTEIDLLHDAMDRLVERLARPQ